MKVFVLVLALVATFHWSYGEHIHAIPVVGGLSGSGTTTRYWDCCKPSCAWAENLVDTSKSPVSTCAADGVTVVDAEIASACVDGTAYMCSNQQAQVVNSSLAYGFAAASFTGGADTNYCCACFLLSFQGELSGKQLLVQVTNTGGDLGSNQFDLAIPGGGVGIYNGCQSQWNTGPDGWGDRYGGVSSDSDCDQLPSALQSGCHFRFQYLNGVSNPQVTFEQVQCPGQLTGISGCDYPS